MDRSRIGADEKAVLDVVKIVKLMVNPFNNEHEDLMHLASGTVASSALSDDMKMMKKMKMPPSTLRRPTLSKKLQTFTQLLKRQI